MRFHIKKKDYISVKAFADKYEDSPHQNLLFSPRKLTFVPIQKQNKDSVSTNKAFILKNKISSEEENKLLAVVNGKILYDEEPIYVSNNFNDIFLKARRSGKIHFETEILNQS